MSIFAVISFYLWKMQPISWLYDAQKSKIVSQYSKIFGEII